MKHKHHKVPKHAGGTNDPENIIELTIEEHAEVHRKLHEEYGRWQDQFAWQLLSGLASGGEDVRAEAARRGKAALMADPVRLEHVRQNRIAGVRRAYANGFQVWNKGRNDCAKISENVKRQAKSENFHCIGDYQRGRTFDDSHRQKLSERALKREKHTCEYCAKTVSPAMFARWHGVNCKRRS